MKCGGDDVLFISPRGRVGRRSSRWCWMEGLFQDDAGEWIGGAALRVNTARRGEARRVPTYPPTLLTRCDAMRCDAMMTADQRAQHRGASLTTDIDTRDSYGYSYSYIHPYTPTPLHPFPFPSFPRPPFSSCICPPRALREPQAPV